MERQLRIPAEPVPIGRVVGRQQAALPVEVGAAESSHRADGADRRAAGSHSARRARPRQFRCENSISTLMNASTSPAAYTSAHTAP